jgi:hypothetical protein
MATVTIAGSGTPIEDEYRRLCEGIGRCKPQAFAFDASLYAPEVVAKAREMWRVRMRAEHESVPAFIGLALQMVQANATLDAQAVVLRMAADEVRHAEICGETVRALGGEPACEVALDKPMLAIHRGCSPEERALRNVIFGNCLVETVNTAHLVDVHDSMSDPCLREATRRLLADEVLHGAFGFDYLRAWTPWLDAHPAVRPSIDRYLRRAFVELEHLRSGAGAPPRTLSADEVALGIPSPRRLPEVFYQTVEAALVPALESFGFEAGAAWRARSKDAPLE